MPAATLTLTDFLVLMHDDVAHGRTAGHILAILSLPYADHPDYREEWKP